MSADLEDVTQMRSWRRAVVKVGSALVAPDGVPSDRDLEGVARFVDATRARGLEVVVVSSGAVASGLEVGERRPRTIPEKQALAALGQPRLMGRWGRLLNAPVAQVLLTHDDLVHRGRYLNARNTFAELLRRGVIPIVNENDTVAVEELKVGDNDNLAAHVAVLIESDLLVICTDVAGLYNADPRSVLEAELVPVVERIDASVRAMAGGAGTESGTGGMRTKIEAAEKATARGIDTVLLDGTSGSALEALAAGRVRGTLFQALDPPMPARKHWLAHTAPLAGRVTIDVGAARAVLEDGASLLASGVTDLEGDFGRADSVEVVTLDGRALARGASRYSATELARIRGRRSSDLEDEPGFSGPAIVIHRDDLVLIDPPSDD